MLSLMTTRALNLAVIPPAGYAHNHHSFPEWFSFPPSSNDPTEEPCNDERRWGGGGGRWRRDARRKLYETSPIKNPTLTLEPLLVNWAENKTKKKKSLIASLPWLFFPALLFPLIQGSFLLSHQGERQTPVLFLSFPRWVGAPFRRLVSFADRGYCESRKKAF